MMGKDAEWDATLKEVKMPVENLLMPMATDNTII